MIQVVGVHGLVLQALLSLDVDGMDLGVLRGYSHLVAPVQRIYLTIRVKDGEI